MKNEMLQKIDDALVALERANIPIYFELIGEVLKEASQENYMPPYNQLRNEYIYGQNDATYVARLRVFADTIKENIRESNENISTHSEAKQGNTIVFAPKVFNIPKKGVAKKQVCVIFDFDEHMDTYEGIRTVCNNLGFSCVKANDILQHGAFLQNVFEMIYTSQIAICDFTGANSNVFYEAGIAHTLGKEVIPITQSMEFVPSDLKYINMIVYESVGDLQSRLRLLLKTLI